jgi:uncharacterized membrane protein YciS (DUF1049 family)
MTKKNKPVFSYEYQLQEQKYDLRIARIFGFSVGFIAGFLVIASLFLINGTI